MCACGVQDLSEQHTSTVVLTEPGLFLTQQSIQVAVWASLTRDSRWQ